MEDNKKDWVGVDLEGEVGGFITVLLIKHDP
jgi:hypothetical protein